MDWKTNRMLGNKDNYTPPTWLPKPQLDLVKITLESLKKVT